MKFAGLQKTTLLDFPGRVACIVFTSGCPFDCFYCHNRETIDGRLSVDPAPIRAFLEKRAGLLDGVVVTGGEPTVQADLPEFIRWLKRSLGYAVKLDTNGWRPDAVSALLAENLLDYVAIDYKAPAARYREICGPRADAAAVQETIRRVAASGVAYELRTTKAPTLGEADFALMRSEIATQLGTPPRWRYNDYRIPEHYKPEDRARILAR